MVIGDFGCMQMSDPNFRLRKKMRFGDSNLDVCTPNYKSPDVWLGSQRYQGDLDMWSFGCVAAEVYSRQMLIDSAATATRTQSPREFLEAIASIVSRGKGGSQPACPASWLEKLPLYKKWYGCSGQAWLTERAATAGPWPPSMSRGLPSRPLPADPRMFGVAPTRQTDRR